MNIALLLEMAASSLGYREAVVAHDGRPTYEELQQRSRASAAFIRSKAGATVAYVGLHSIAFPLALFGSAIAGRPFAPMNYRLADADLRRLLERTAPSIVLADNDMIHRVSGIQDVEPIRTADFLFAGDEGAIEGDEDADIAVLLFTSGTTGEPKAGVLRHRHLSSYVISTVDFASSGEEEAALVSVPPYHIAGISALLTSIYSGRRLVQLAAFTPEAWVDAAASEAITHAMVVPTMLGRILDVLEQRNQQLPALRHLSYGGGRMPEPVIRRAMTRLPHVDFVNAYGLTETSSTIAMLGPEDHRRAVEAEDPAWRRRLGSAGQPLPSLEIEIRGPDGEVVPRGVSGEIWVRGEQVSGEYLGRNALRDDGWYPTNDAGQIDDEGYLFVEGRLDDVIVRGGENISPGEIEDVLRSHPQVRDAAVIGLPDDEWGERITAVVVMGGGLSPVEVLDFAKRRLRTIKVPQEIISRDFLPYTETGKLLRRVLRQEILSAAAVADS